MQLNRETDIVQKEHDRLERCGKASAYEVNFLESKTTGHDRSHRAGGVGFCRNLSHIQLSYVQFSAKLYVAQLDVR